MSKTRFIVVNNKEYEVTITTNALAIMEEVTGKTIGEIGAGFSKGSASIAVIRAAVFAGLREGARLANRTPPIATLEEAGDWVDKVGMVEIMKPVGQAMQDAFPDREEGDTVGDGGEDPTIGTPSGSKQPLSE